jgi:UPF0716 protein FxsA
MFGRIVLLSILVLPLIEIALFIMIGQAIGVLPTLLGIVLTGVIGALVLRWQGTAALREMQFRMQRGEMPARQMGDAMLIGLAGFLLLLPGYFTDLVGLLLLLPVTRDVIYRHLARNLRVVDVTTTYRRTDEPGLIDLDRSGWRDDGPSL